MGMGRFIDVQVVARSPDGRWRARWTSNWCRSAEVAARAFTGDLGLPEDMLREAVVDRFGASPAGNRAADIARAVGGAAWPTTATCGRRSSVPARDDPAAPGGDLVLRVTVRAQGRGADGVVPGRRPGGRPATCRRACRSGRARSSTAPALRRRLDDAAERWRARGYYEARADCRRRGVGERRRGGPDDHVCPRPAGDRVGPATTPLPPKQLAELVPVAREGSVDEDLLEDSEARIEESPARAGLPGRRRLVRTLAERRPAADRLHGQARGPLPRGGRPLRGSRRELSAADLAPLMKPGEGPAVRAGAARRRHAGRSSREYRRRGYADASIRPAVEPGAGRADRRRGPRRRESAHRRGAAHPRHGGRDGGQPRADRAPNCSRARHPRRTGRCSSPTSRPTAIASSSGT